MSRDLLAGHKRMRASLAAILHLDPPGVTARIAEMDRAIAELSARLAPDRLFETASPSAPVPDFVSVGALRAA